jgi:hypothetical protein
LLLFRLGLFTIALLVSVLYLNIHWQTLRGTLNHTGWGKLNQRERDGRKRKKSQTTKRKGLFSVSNAVDVAAKVSKISKAPVRQKPKQTAQTRRAAKRRPTHTITDNDDTPCAMCGKRCNEPPLEDWKQCPVCQQWFHERCCPEDTDTCYTCLG